MPIKSGLLFDRHSAGMNACIFRQIIGVLCQMAAVLPVVTLLSNRTGPGAVMVMIMLAFDKEPDFSDGKI